MNLEPLLRTVVAFRTPHLQSLVTPEVVKAYLTPGHGHPTFRTLNLFPGWIHPLPMPPFEERGLLVTPDYSAPVLALVRNHGWTTLESRTDDDGPTDRLYWVHSVDSSWEPGEGAVQLWVPLPDLTETDLWDKNLGTAR